MIKAGMRVLDEVGCAYSSRSGDTASSADPLDAIPASCLLQIFENSPSRN